MSDKHIDNMTIALYLGGRIRFKKNFLTWIQCHLCECDECAQKVEKQLECITRFQEFEGSDTSKQDETIKQESSLREVDSFGLYEDQERLNLVTAGYNYPSAPKDRYTQILEEMKQYFKESSDFHSDHIIQLIDQILKHLSCKGGDDSQEASDQGNR